MSVTMFPDDWKTVRLGDCFEITSSKRVFQREWRTSGVPFYRARELAVLGERGHVDNELFIDREMFERYREAHGAPSPGDFLVTGVGTLGKTYVVRDGDEFYFKDGNIIWFKRSRDVDSSFLDQLYKTPFILDQVFGNSGGSTVGTYTITNAKLTVIPLPPRQEQLAISAALTDADKQVSLLERIITKKQAIKQGMMQELLTGRIRLPGFTSEWTEVRLSDVAFFLKGVGLAKSDVRPAGANPCVHYGELFTYYGAEIQEVRGRTDRTDLPVRSMTGDVLMPTSDVTPRGLAKASALMEEGVILGGDVLIIRPNPRLVHGPFLSRVIRADANQVLRLVRGSTVFHLYAGDMRNFAFGCPELPEQQAISEAVRAVDLELDALAVRLRKARLIKTGMMQELLTGRTRLPVVERAA